MHLKIIQKILERHTDIPEKHEIKELNSIERQLILADPHNTRTCYVETNCYQIRRVS